MINKVGRFPLSSCNHWYTVLSGNINWYTLCILSIDLFEKCVIKARETTWGHTVASEWVRLLMVHAWIICICACATSRWLKIWNCFFVSSFLYHRHWIWIVCHCFRFRFCFLLLLVVGFLWGGFVFGCWCYSVPVLWDKCGTSQFLNIKCFFIQFTFGLRIWLFHLPTTHLQNDTLLSFLLIKKPNNQWKPPTEKTFC